MSSDIKKYFFPVEIFDGSLESGAECVHSWLRNNYKSVIDILHKTHSLPYCFWSLLVLGSNHFFFQKCRETLNKLSVFWSHFPKVTWKDMILSQAKESIRLDKFDIVGN